MKNAALLIIDMQQGLIDEDPFGSTAFLENMEMLLEAARAQALPVVYVQHSSDDGGDLVPGTKRWQICKALSPRAGEDVVQKRYNSAFMQTTLHDILQAKQIETLIIVGMQTEFCVDATIKSAFEKGYNILVPAKMTTTFEHPFMPACEIQKYYETCIWQWRYAQVLPLKDVIRKIEAPRQG